jgi:integrase
VSIITTLSDSAVDILFNEDIYSKNNGKRDRAMVMLALCLGLRCSDITSLRFKDIDWEHDCLTITQKKTGVEITLPLLPDVGNALMDYILYARPSIGCEYVFIQACAPYGPVVSRPSVLEKYLPPDELP